MLESGRLGLSAGFTTLKHFVLWINDGTFLRLSFFISQMGNDITYMDPESRFLRFDS